MTIAQQKSAVRAQARQRLRGSTPQERTAKSGALFAKVEALPVFRAASHILAYCSLPDEVQTLAFMLRWCGAKHLYLPVVVGNDLALGRFCGLHSLTRTAAFGIREPEVDAEAPPIDLAIVPGLAFDGCNNRLGRGRGYYDRFLRASAAYKLGVCFDFQLLERLPVEPLDVKMDAVVCA